MNILHRTVSLPIVRLQGGLIAIAGMAMALMPVASVAAANITVDKNIVAGAQNSADTAWANRTFTCNKWVESAGVPGGSATGNGSSATPWKSLKYAVSQAQPGDFVCVKTGTYQENNFVPAVTGTAQNPISFAAYNGTVTITPNPAQSTTVNKAVFDFNNNVVGSLGYWRLDGMTIDRQLTVNNVTTHYDGPGVQILGAPAVAGDEGAVHHVVIQNMAIRNGMAGMGLQLRGRVYDAKIYHNTIENFSRYKNSGGSITYSYTAGYGRADAHGISIEGMPRTTAGVASPSIQRILIDTNTLQNNGGDGLQCLGGAAGSDPDAYASASDPLDLDLVDNRVVNTAGSAPVEENGLDIKSCQYVSIRNHAPALGDAPQQSKIAEFLPTTSAKDYTGNNANGEAIVMHYYARNVLVEYTRIWNACTGIAIGRDDAKVTNVVLRRNLIFSQRFNQALADGSAADAARCKGTAIQISNADHMDIYHNTIVDIPQNGIQVGSSTATTPSADIDIWNNIFNASATVGAEPRYWIRLTNIGSNVDSDYNLFWHDGGTAAGDNHFYSGGQKTLTQWRVDRDLTRPASVVWTNPVFVTNPSINDYYLQPTSPALDGALNNTGATSCGSGPDIGFLESC